MGGSRKNSNILSLYSNPQLHESATQPGKRSRRQHSLHHLQLHEFATQPGNFTIEVEPATATPLPLSSSRCRLTKEMKWAEEGIASNATRRREQHYNTTTPYNPLGSQSKTPSIPGLGNQARLQDTPSHHVT